MTALCLALLFAVFVQLLPSSYADLGLAVIFNNGTVPTNGAVCTARDIQVITAEIEDQQSRLLRRIGSTLKHMGSIAEDSATGVNIEHIIHRDLQTYAPKCKDYCRGKVSGMCMHPECKGYRRRRALFQTKQRRIDDSCASATVDINDELNDFLRSSKISTNCKSLIKLPRQIVCFDESRYAAVESFVLVSNNGATKKTMKNGMSICSSSTMAMNIEAVANACLEELELELRGPISQEVRYEKDDDDFAPYMIFGSGNGRILPVGTYTLKTELDGSIIPPASITFSVQKCA